MTGPGQPDRRNREPVEAGTSNHAHTGSSRDLVLLPDSNLTPLFGPDLQPGVQLLALLEHLGVKHDGTLASIHEATQEVMRNINAVLKGEASPDIKVPLMVHATDIEAFATQPLGDKTRELLDDISLYSRVDAPQGMEADAAIAFGGRAERVRDRLLHLAHQWNEREVRFDSLVLTGSARELSDQEHFHERPQDLLAITSGRGASELPHIEAEMMLWLIKHHPEVPEAWRDGTVNLYSKMALNRTAPGERPSAGTLETVRAPFNWVDVQAAGFVSEPAAVQKWEEIGAHFITASSQPYTLRQSLAIAGAFIEQGSPELVITGIGDIPIEVEEASFVVELAKLIDTEKRLLES